MATKEQSVFQSIKSSSYSLSDGRFQTNSGTTCTSSATSCNGCQFCPAPGGELCPNACIPGASVCSFCPPSSTSPLLTTIKPSISLTQGPVTCLPSVSPSSSTSEFPSSNPKIVPSVTPTSDPTSSFSSLRPSKDPIPFSQSVNPSTNPTSASPLISSSESPSSPPSVSPSSDSISSSPVNPTRNPTSSYSSISPSNNQITSSPTISHSSDSSPSPFSDQSSNPMLRTSSEPTIIRQSIRPSAKSTVIPSMKPSPWVSSPRKPSTKPSTNVPVFFSPHNSTLKPTIAAITRSATIYPSKSPSLTTTHPPALPPPTPYPTVVISLPTSSPAAAASTQTSSTVISMSIIITLAAAFGGICMVIGAIILYKRFRIDVEKENKVRENDHHSNLSYKHASRSGKSNELNPYYFYDSRNKCHGRFVDCDVQQGLRQSIHTTQDTQDDLEWNSSFRIRSSPYMSPRSPHLLDPNRSLSSGLNFNTNIRHRPRTSIDRDRSLDREETNKHNMMSELSSKSFKLSSTLRATNRDLDTENYLESEEKGILRSQSCRSLFTGVSGLTTGSSKSPRQNFTTTASRIITSAWNSPVITKSSDLEMGRSLSAKSRIGSCSAKLTRLRDQRQRIEATFALNTDDNICVADELRLYKKA